MLEGNGYEVAPFFYNPNIHPFREFRRRLESARRLCEIEGLTLIEENEEPYPLERTLSLLLSTPDRCAVCFEMRLVASARKASELGLVLLTTTLLVSPYQDRDLVCEAGDRACRDHGIGFLPLDFRSSYGSGMDRARELELYTQPYCGCVMSERDRYR